LQLLAAAHILRVNCVEMAGDKPGQPAQACEIFGIECPFSQSKFRPLKFKGSSVRRP